MAFRRPKFLRVAVWTVARPPLPRIATAQAHPTCRATMNKLFLAAALAMNPLAAREVWAQQNSTPPDFSGVWGHSYWPSFEPPASGSGPVTNRSRLRGGPQAGVSNPSELAGDYTSPILKPWAADVVKKRGEDEINVLLSPTPYNQCWPQGVP